MWNPFKELGDKAEDKAASALARVFTVFIVKFIRMGIRGMNALGKEFDPERIDEYIVSAAAIKK